MIFTLIPESNTIIFDSSDDAWEAHACIACAFSFPFQPIVVCAGQYENALALDVSNIGKS